MDVSKLRETGRIYRTLPYQKLKPKFNEGYRLDAILEFLILRYFSILPPLVRSVGRRRVNYLIPDRPSREMEDGEGSPYRHRDAVHPLKPVSEFRIPGVRIDSGSNQMCGKLQLNFLDVS